MNTGTVRTVHQFDRSTSSGGVTVLKRIWFFVLVMSVSFCVPHANAKPFLETKRQKAQCKIVQAWFQDMEQLAGLNQITGKNVLDPETPEADRPGEYALIEALAPMYSDRVFEPTFGKSYFDLLQQEAQKIRYAINSCVPLGATGPRYWVGNALARRTLDSDWGAEISKANDDPRSIAIQMKIRREKREAREQAQTISRQNFETEQQQLQLAQSRPLEQTLYFAGKQIGQGRGFRIHEFRFNSQDVKTFCSVFASQLRVSVVLTDDAIKLDPPFINSLFENTLEPILKQTCPQNTGVRAEFFFENVHFTSAGSELSSADVRNASYRQDVPVASASVAYQPATGRTPVLIEYFKGGAELSSDLELYQTLPGLRQLAARNFQSPERFAAIEARRQQLEQLERSAGVSISTERVKVLLYGDDTSKRYFEERRATALSVGAIVAPMLAYSKAMQASCPSSTPGGMASAIYTSKAESGAVVEEANFLVPRDFFSSYQFLVESGRVAGERGSSGPLYQDFERIIKRNGCSSDVVTRIHNSIKDSLNTMYLR